MVIYQTKVSYISYEWQMKKTTDVYSTRKNLFFLRLQTTAFVFLGGDC